MVASRVLLLLLLPLLAGGVLSPVRPARAATLSRAATSFSPTPRKAATLPLRIDGQWYDLTDWADEHPGGAYSQPERSGAARVFFSHAYLRETFSHFFRTNIANVETIENLDNISKR